MFDGKAGVSFFFDFTRSFDRWRASFGIARAFLFAFPARPRVVRAGIAAGFGTGEAVLCGQVRTPGNFFRLFRRDASRAVTNIVAPQLAAATQCKRYDKRKPSRGGSDRCSATPSSAVRAFKGSVRVMPRGSWSSIASGASDGPSRLLDHHVHRFNRWPQLPPCAAEWAA